MSAKRPIWYIKLPLELAIRIRRTTRSGVLFPLVKSRDSCQPEQALEPSVGHAYSDKETTVNIDNNPEESDTSKNSEDRLFDIM